MGEVVNLRLARKAKARAAATTKAGRNRAAHGRSKAEKQASGAEIARAQRRLDGAKLEASADQGQPEH